MIETHFTKHQYLKIKNCIFMTPTERHIMYEPYPFKEKYYLFQTFELSNLTRLGNPLRNSRQHVIY